MIFGLISNKRTNPIKLPITSGNVLMLLYCTTIGFDHEVFGQHQEKVSRTDSITIYSDAERYQGQLSARIRPRKWDGFWYNKLEKHGFDVQSYDRKNQEVNLYLKKSRQGFGISRRGVLAASLATGGMFVMVGLMKAIFSFDNTAEERQARQNMATGGYIVAGGAALTIVLDGRTKAHIKRAVKARK